MGVKVSNTLLVRKWFLVVPSILFVIQTFIGYLRVYQQKSIEWLFIIYYPDEFNSGIYRLTFPANYMLGLDILQRQSSKISKAIAFVPSFFLAYGSVVAPAYYIYWAYSKAFRDLGADWQLIVSAILSIILIIHGFMIIFRSQKI